MWQRQRRRNKELGADLVPPFQTVARRLARLESQFLKPYRAVLAFAAIGMLLQSLLLLSIPLMQGWVVDQLVAPIRPSLPGQSTGLSLGSWMRTLSEETPAVAVFLVLAGSIACYLIRMGIAWKVAIMMSRMSLEIVRDLTDAMHRKMLRLPVAYFDREQTGRLMSRITSDVGSLLIFLNTGSLQLASDLVIALGISVTLLWLQWQLGLISFVVVPFYIASHRFFARTIRVENYRVRSLAAGMYALLSERVSAVRVVRSFAQEKKEIHKLGARIDAHKAAGWKMAKMAAWQAALAIFISGLGTLAILCYGFHLVFTSRMSVGELLAFYALLAQLYNPLLRLSQFHGTLTGTLVAIDRILEILDEPETVRDRPNARRMARPRGAIDFREVSFGYSEKGPLALDRIQLAVEPGMKIGILGPSGSGKSTLLALAPRLYEIPPGQGAVLFDSQDVRDLRLTDLRRAVMLVPQQAMLFGGTIRSNLTYACPWASSSAIHKALEITDLAETIATLPRGLETTVGERGVSLSGGQKQRLALARALLANPAALLLDDCTSALDAETEIRVFAGLWDFLADRTCLIVSHRIMSIHRSDFIIVLNEGRIVEQGTHEQLLGMKGFYAETFQAQAGIRRILRPSPILA